jgi:integrase
VAGRTRRATIQLPRLAVGALREQRRRQLEDRLAAGGAWEDGVFVFTTPTGRPLDSRNVTQDLQAGLRRAGLPRVRFHDLRHTAATIMLEAGEELGIVSRVLGHADFGTRSDTYAHLTRKMLGRAADRMDSALERGAVEAG